MRPNTVGPISRGDRREALACVRWARVQSRSSSYELVVNRNRSMDLQMTENGALEVRLQLQGDEVWGKTRRSFESGALGRTGGLGEVGASGSAASGTAGGSY